jgi:citrate lyase beta subunit
LPSSGKPCINPAQVDVANAVFGVFTAEIASGREVVDAWSRGRVVDLTVVARAQRALPAEDIK